MDDIMNNNVVTISGITAMEPVYSHSVFGEGFYESAIEIERLSGQKDVIPVTISERLLADSDFAVGNKVAIDGQFRSYNKLFNGKSKLMLTVFVRSLFDPANEIQNANNIELTGFVCKPPVFRTTPFKREIADILIAVNRAYNKSDYIPCIAWGRNARFAAKLEVGDKITLSGRIQSREYQKLLDDGSSETRVAYEISVGRIGYGSESDDVDERNENTI